MKGEVEAQISGSSVRATDLQRSVGPESACVKGKVDPTTVQGILRHSDIRTTMNLYTQDDRDEKAGSAGRLPGRIGLGSV